MGPLGFRMWHMANLLGWFFWYLRDFGRRIKNPNITPNPKTQQHKQTRQGRCPGGGTTPGLGLLCALAWGVVPTVMPEHQSPWTSEVRRPRPRRQVPASCLSHRGGLREIRKPVPAQGKRQGPTQSEEGHCLQNVHQLPQPDTPSLCQIPFPFSHHQWQGLGYPKPGSLLSRERYLDISSS